MGVEKEGESSKYGQFETKRWAGRARERQGDGGVAAFANSKLWHMPKLSNPKCYFNKLFSLLRLPYFKHHSDFDSYTSTNVMPRCHSTSLELFVSFSYIIRVFFIL